MHTYTGPLTRRTIALGSTLALLLGGCGSDNGNETQGSGAAASSSSAFDCENLKAYSQPDGSVLYCEQVQNSTGVDAFRTEDFENLTMSKIRRLMFNETVLVECVQLAPLDAASSAQAYADDPHSVWYRLAGPADVEGGYSATNSYYNYPYSEGEIPFNEQPPIDTHVPSCGPAIE
jgi:hypothetical protein